MTGEDDLSCVTSLKYTIDTSTSSLVDLLALLPALRSLTLESGSCVTSLRELGSGARQLEVQSHLSVYSSWLLYDHWLFADIKIGML
jgi:hypothetical protein